MLNLNALPRSNYTQLSAKQIVDLVVSGKLNPDPIGQRPPVSQGHDKSRAIVSCLLHRFGIGMITVRDIRDDSEMQKVYPGTDYLVIDGGHRIRAIVNFYKNKFKVLDHFSRELDYDWLPTMIPIDITVCDSQQAIEKFRNLNQTTDVNWIEMLMCDDQSSICRYVRSTTRPYKEYGNKPHPVFETYYDSDGEEAATYFKDSPNHRRKWDEWVFIAILKALGGGNVDAGQAEIEDLISEEYKGNNKLTKNCQKVVDRFLSDMMSFQKNRYIKMNTHVFAAFQVVWFALFEKNPVFKINDYEQFHDSFMYAYTYLTGTGRDSAKDTETISIDGVTENLKEYVRKNRVNFSNSKVQRKVAELILEEMGDDIGVVFRDTKRSLTTSEREERLALQGYKCAIDGKQLKLEDSVWGHDTAWAQGGDLMDGAVIRRTHNRDMGTTTLDEYRLILSMREGK